MSDALSAVDHQEGDVGFGQCLLGPQHGVVLGGFVDTRSTADTGGVEHPERFAVEVDHGIDRIAGRPRLGRHQDSLLPQQLIQEGRLADVRSAQDRQCGHRRIVGFALGEEGRQRIEEIPDAAPVQRADRMGLAEAQSPQCGGVRLVAGSVDLVGDQQVGHTRTLHQPGDGLVVVARRHRGVGDEQHGVGAAESRLGLLPDAGHQGVVTDSPAASIHDQETAPRPVGPELLAVPCDARLLFDHRGPAPQDAIDQRRLPHVGPSHDRDDREPAHERPRCSEGRDGGITGASIGVGGRRFLP